MTRFTLTWDRPIPEEWAPVPGDVFRDVNTGTLRRIESIRPVSRGPNVGRRFICDVTRIEVAGIPEGAEIWPTHRIRR